MPIVNLKINSRYNLAISILTKEEIENIKLASGPDDLGGDIFGDIVGFLSNLGGLKGVILGREEPDEKIKFSFRTSDPDIDISQLASVFGGGGHSKASGLSVDGKLKKIADGWEFSV